MTLDRVAEILKLGARDLEEGGIETPKLDAEVILSNLLQVDRVKLHIYPEREISREICKKFWQAVEKRKKAMPIQYIIGKKEFMGLEFCLEEGVLIPRNDTEILVEKILDLYEKHFAGQKVRILDMGVGSGAIAVSLAKYISFAQVYGVDISAKAMELARKNSTRHGVAERTKFLQGDLFAGLKGLDLEGSFDFIVSNPPYIARDIIKGLDRQVADYEPIIALDGGRDGLDFYRRIIKEAPLYLGDGGWIGLEIGYDQGDQVKKLLQGANFVGIDLIKDLAGLDRVLIGRLG